MPTITALLPQPRHKDRVNLFLDGEFAQALHLSLAQEAALATGRRLSYRELRDLADREEYLTGLDTAYRFLGYRSRSEAEVRERLRRNKVHLAIIDQVLAKLREQRLIDDASFAQQWVANREAYRPRSRRMMQWELRRKGVGEETAGAAVSQVDDDEAAYRAGERRAGRLSAAGFETFRKRVGDLLLRRGFSYGVVQRALQRLWDERAAHPDAGDGVEPADAAAFLAEESPAP